MEGNIDERHYIIAGNYSKREELDKLREEIGELTDELQKASNPFGFPDLVYVTPNTWSEMADVINVIIHMAIQHDKLEVLLEQIDYKLDRQMQREKKKGERIRGWKMFAGFVWRKWIKNKNQSNESSWRQK